MVDIFYKKNHLDEDMNDEQQNDAHVEGSTGSVVPESEVSQGSVEESAEVSADVQEEIETKEE